MELIILKRSIIPPPPYVINESELHEWAEDEDDAQYRVEVERFDVTHFGQRWCHVAGQRDQSQQRAWAFINSNRRNVKLGLYFMIFETIFFSFFFFFFFFY